jgi:hypothetical protein
MGKEADDELIEADAALLGQAGELGMQRSRHPEKQATAVSLVVSLVLQRAAQ